MEHYTQNYAHTLQRYIVISLEVCALFTGFHLGNLISTSIWSSMGQEELLLCYVCFVTWIGGGILFDYYTHTSIYQPRQILKISWINLGLLSFISFLLYKSYPLYFPGFWFNLFTGVMLAVGLRFIISFLYRHRRIFFSLTGEHNKVMIVGSGETAVQLTEFFKQAKGSQIFHYKGSHTGGKYVKEDIQNLRKDIRTFKQLCLDQEVNEIYYTLPLEATDVIEEIADFADNHYITFKVANDFHLNTKYKDYSVAFFNHTPIISLRKDPLAQVSNQVMKRLFDLVFSSLVILLVMPWLFLIIAIAIRWNSKGPILYKQKRSGRKNRPFTCYKFRTMYVQDESETSTFKQASKDDPRITQVGAFLRKTSLDEFPQFFNVFLGQMSVVGPRPHPTKLNEQYIPLIKKYPFRYFITPGITGHAQVNGYRGETKDPEEMEKRVEYDSWYIQNWRFLLDLKIILQTIFNISSGEEKAY